MPKANRTCYCCGHEYYYCPSCPGDRKDPQIYTMWDSEVCKDIFDTLVSESTKKITTKECKNKLIELGIDKIEIRRESVKKHVNRVMSYEDVVDSNIETKENKEEVVIEVAIAEEDSEVEEKTEEQINEKTELIKLAEVTEVTEVIETDVKIKNKKRKSSVKNIDN